MSKRDRIVIDRKRTRERGGSERKGDKEKEFRLPFSLYDLLASDNFIYLGSSVSSIESDVNIHLAKSWSAIYWLSIMLKSDLYDKMKQDFFLTEAVSVLPNGWTTWTLTKGT